MNEYLLLYLLFQLKPNPMYTLPRTDVCREAKIGSSATYTACDKDILKVHVAGLPNYLLQNIYLFGRF